MVRVTFHTPLIYYQKTYTEISHIYSRSRGPQKSECVTVSHISITITAEETKYQNLKKTAVKNNKENYHWGEGKLTKVFKLPGG